MVSGLLLAGENPYKGRACERASCRRPDVTHGAARGCGRTPTVREIPGVGAALAKTIEHLHQHGTTSKLDAMRAALPVERPRLISDPGTPRRIKLCSFIESSASRASRNSNRLAVTSGSRRKGWAPPFRRRCWTASSSCAGLRATGESTIPRCSNGDDREPVSFAPRAQARCGCRRVQAPDASSLPTWR